MKRLSPFIGTIGILAAALLFGCAGDSSGPGNRDDIVVFGHLYVGERVDSVNAIRISRVGPIDSRYVRDDAAVLNATVTITRSGATPETLLPVGPGAYANPAIEVMPRSQYLLRIDVPGLPTVRAATVTPSAIHLDGGPPELPRSVRHEVLQDSFPIFVTCDDAEQILLTDVYCMASWDSVVYIYPFGNHKRPDNYEEFGGDDGEPRHIFAYFRVNDVVTDERGSKIDFYGAMMAFYGTHRIHVSAIDDNTYRYLYRDFPEESGGIIGGIGLFGSACRREWEVKVTP
jgi:hypothetical protein